MQSLLIALILSGAPVSKSDFKLCASPPVMASTPNEEPQEFLNYKNGLEVAKLLNKKLHVGTNLTVREHFENMKVARAEEAIYCICDSGLFDKGVTKLFYDKERGDFFKVPQPKLVQSTKTMCTEEGCFEVQEGFSSGFSGSCSSCSRGR